jgi:prepilin-type N-terminal cleavage/methylation domain-containing protein
MRTRDRTRHLRPQGGFTLIELVTSLVLLGLIASVGTSLVSDNFRTVMRVNARHTTADQVRYAMDRMAREIRELKYSESSGYAVTAMSATSLAFKRDIAGSEVTVTLAKASGSSDVTLGYSSPAVSATLVPHASSLALEYLALDGTATTSLANLRFVVVSLTVLDPVSGSQVSQRMRISLRNS